MEDKMVAAGGNVFWGISKVWVRPVPTRYEYRIGPEFDAFFYEYISRLPTAESDAMFLMSDGEMWTRWEPGYKAWLAAGFEFPAAMIMAGAR